MANDIKTLIVITIDIIIFVFIFLWFGGEKTQKIIIPTMLASPIASLTPKPTLQASKGQDGLAKPTVQEKGSNSPKLSQSNIIYRPDFEYISSVYGPTSEQGKVGYGLKGQDVTKKLKFSNDGEVLNPFVCCDDTLGDPAKGIPKTLTIRYKRSGRRYKAILNENTQIEGSLP